VEEPVYLMIQIPYDTECTQPILGSHYDWLHILRQKIECQGLITLLIMSPFRPTPCLQVNRDSLKQFEYTQIGKQQSYMPSSLDNLNPALQPHTPYLTTVAERALAVCLVGSFPAGPEWQGLWPHVKSWTQVSFYCLQRLPFYFPTCFLGLGSLSFLYHCQVPHYQWRSLHSCRHGE
jgi:hypothetical protein